MMTDGRPGEKQQKVLWLDSARRRVQGRCVERGTNPRAFQQVMGHKSLETTMGYLHAESLSVRSHLEALLA